MKKHFFALSLFVSLLTITSIQAQSVHFKAEQVPAKAKIGFSNKYPQATDAIWAKEENGLYTAQFWDVDNNMYINAYIEEDGTWSKTIMELTPTAFTEAIRQYMKTNYATATVILVMATQENNGRFTYKIELETETKLITLFMDRQANVLNKTEEVINVDVSGEK